MTALVFCLIDSTKNHWSPISWWCAGRGTLSIGAHGVALAFPAGHRPKSLI